MDQETLVLKKWHLIMAIVAAIAVPSVSATATFYKFQLKQAEKDAETTERISRLELDSSKAFADKSDLKALQSEVRDMYDDVIMIKSMLKRR